ncbi:NUDIX domain-containing protein [Devosia albogilva]|uniref:NUDIX domain-containing protein n=1 Tax=Devosia albogilva TaxID=429726 RepID=A0ABW5QPA1_9HYPH
MVLRLAGAKREILVFRHALAGMQLVKGTLEPGETPLAGALRELTEEAGLLADPGAGPQWTSAALADGQIWHFVPVSISGVPDRFDFFTADDCGHLFRFGWWTLGKEPGPEWHEIFVRALREIHHRHEAA